MEEQQLWRRFDWLLFAVVFLLSLLGIAMVYSTTHNTEEFKDYWIRQCLFLTLGTVACFTIARFDYRNLELFALPMFLAFLVVLGIVLSPLGIENNGSQSWISIGITDVQPTEAGKFLLVIFLAWFLSWYADRMAHLSYLLIAVCLLLIPMGLIFVQPDFGMTAQFAFIGGLLILMGGIHWWQVGMMVGLGIGALPFIWSQLEGYMLRRFQMFLYPELYQNDNFNIEQAQIAIGAGGWLGQGWGYGSQNQLHFLRVRHTDFIFSVIGEELGWIGATLVLFLSLYVVWRVLRIADTARDEFGRLIAIGVAAIIFFQVVINIGMNVNLLPVTGLTLPFVSYGGSSLLSMMAAIGLAQSVVMRHRKMDFQ